MPYIALCCLLLLCAVCSCASQRKLEQSPQPPTTISDRANEDALKLLIARYQARVKDLPKDGTKKNYERNSERVLGSLLVLLLDSTPEYRQLCLKQLLEVPLDKIESGPESAVVRAFVMLLAAQNNHERLADLLAHVCPETFYIHLEVEYYLAEHTADAGLILCDAYERATNERNKLAIARTIVRAFAPVAEREGIWLWTAGLASRRDFVESCKTWYLQHRSQLVLNQDYAENIMHGPDREDYVKNPLWRIRQ